MAEAQDRAVGPDQPGPLGGIECVLGQVELGGGTQRDRELARFLGGGDEKRLPGGLGQPVDALGERCAQPCRQRQGAGKRRPALELRVRERDRKLE